MTVRSENLRNGERIEKKTRRVGFLRPGHVEHAFIALLYLALLVLVLLSVVGTFYGRRGEDAPIGAGVRTFVLQTWRDMTAAPDALAIAIAIQGVLTLVQYGSRSMAKYNQNWWLLYLAALGWSVYYNYYAYWVPLSALVPWYLAGLLIVAGDVLPEFIAVRRE